MVKEINGYLYSRNQFTNYELRYKIEINDVDGYQHSIDIYTNCKDLTEIRAAIASSLTEKVLDWKITNKATKEQDERISELIDEFLK